PGRKRIAYVVDRERGDPLKHVDVADGVTSENVTDQRRAINIGHHRPRVGLLKRHNVDAGEAAITQESRKLLAGAAVIPLRVSGAELQILAKRERPYLDGDIPASDVGRQLA